MDNVTHTLIGVLVGEGAARAAPAAADGLPAQTRRNVMVATMAVGSNLPDLDFMYSAITGSKLDYLLEHRGYTHTVIGALLTSALLCIAISLWLRWRQLTPSRTDRWILLATALLATLLHVAMDFTNNYGVHPFWPFHNGWLYGDSVFIVEPLLWAACAPLAFVLRTRAARWLVVMVAAAGVALAVFSGFVPRAISLVLALLTLAMLAIGRLAPQRIALAAGVLLWIAVTATFAVGGRVANARAETLAAAQFPQALLHDQVMTPSPANPVCWEIIFVQQEAGEVFLRRAMLSLAPGLYDARVCGDRVLRGPITTPLSPVAAPNDPQVHWYGEIGSSLARLSALKATDCRVSAFMRFARAPWLAEIDGVPVIGDLRYDRGPDLGFAEIDLRGAPRCPSHMPPWPAPLGNMLKKAASAAASRLP